MGFCVVACLPAQAAVELVPAGQRPVPPALYALTHAKVLTQAGQPARDAVVLIRGNQIEAIGEDLVIPPGARVIDLKNHWILPGFIDLHWTPGKEGNTAGNRGARAEEASQDGLRAGTAIANFTGAPGSGTDRGARGPSHESAAVHPEAKAAEGLRLAQDKAETWRAMGFTTVNVVPTQGILRGRSALAQLNADSPNLAVLAPDVFQHAAMETQSGNPTPYPGSLMGVIAVLRQTLLDARHHQEAWRLHRLQPSKHPRPEHHPALLALQPVISGHQKIVIDPMHPLMVDRIRVLTRELGWDPILLATGEEWRRPDLARRFQVPWIVPLTFPDLPKDLSDVDREALELDDLRAWDWAPHNPRLLAEMGHTIALTAWGLPDPKSFRKRLEQAVQCGLEPDTALAALTTTPARLSGMEHLLGSLEPGKLANLVVLDGPFWQSNSKIRETWIGGERFDHREPEAVIARDANDKPKDSKTSSETAAPGSTQVLARVPTADAGPWMRPTSLLITNATLWTCGPEGILEKADLLILNGKIHSIGQNLTENLPKDQKIRVINGTGKEITPGLVDCHSHSMILGGVNEGTLPSSAMVRIGDVVDSETEHIYRQLAGGLTTANLLHGSANPIGGQNAVIKLRHGAGPEGLKFRGAPGGIKFALGENVKQSNWGDDRTSRFPQTRMGVPTFMENRFIAASEYRSAWRAAKADPTLPQPRRDLELEAIMEILDGSRLIHCHSYRQDEILVFLRLMESFQVRVGTLQHVLEGYKIADDIAAHGAGASSFSDWWAYKFEVYDAIPYAGAIMHQRNVLVSFNSDSSDLARRMNLEAAKAFKYGGVPEEEALKFVTLNPAKQLGIDHRIGSLEVGKDADFVIWSGHPLLATSRCEQTWIDGRQYFSLTSDKRRTRARLQERDALLARLEQKESDPAAATPTPSSSEAARAAFFRRAWSGSTSLEYSCCKLHLQSVLQP